MSAQQSIPEHTLCAFAQRAAQLVVLTHEQQRALQVQFDRHQAQQWLERVAPKEAPQALRSEDATAAP